MATSPFYLLRPDELPRSRGDVARDRRTRSALIPLSRALVGTRSDGAVLAATRAALRDLAFGPTDFSPVGDDPDETAPSRANDQSFNMVRVRGAAALVAAHSTLRSLALLLEDVREAGTDLDGERWGRLRRAFATIVALLSDEAPARGAAPAVAPRAPDPADARDALRRWTRGHYAFMSIVQGLVVALNRMAEAFEAEDGAAVGEALLSAAAIMRGADSALRFAGDFPYTAYEKAVRPTLMPPIAPPGMTGLHWRDHKHMVAVLARLRPRFARMDPALQPQLEDFHQATLDAYESHKYVCASFVGTERPSLLMAARTEKTAIETLDHFKAIRAGLLGGSR
jgi:hypothetical protein